MGNQQETNDAHGTTGITVRLSEETRERLKELDEQVPFLEDTLRKSPAFAAGTQKRLNDLIHDALQVPDFVYNPDVNQRLTGVIAQYFDIVDKMKGTGTLAAIDYGELFSGYMKLAFNPLTLVQRGNPAEHLPRLLEKRDLSIVLELPDLNQVYLSLGDISADDFAMLYPTLLSSQEPIVLSTSDFIAYEAMQVRQLRGGILTKLYNLCADVGLVKYTSQNGVSEGAMVDLTVKVQDALSAKGTFAQLKILVRDDGETEFTVETVPHLKYISHPITTELLRNEEKRTYALTEIAREGRKYFGNDDPLFGIQARELLTNRIVALLEHDLAASNKVVRFTIYQEPAKPHDTRPPTCFKVEEITPMF